MNTPLTHRNFFAVLVLAAVVLSIFILLLPRSAQAQAVSTAFPAQTLTVGHQKIRAEIAATASDRQQGLMFRTSMAANHGMLFVFDEVASHCFWMRNTPLPLTIGFIDAAGVLINTLDMAPFNESPHCPTQPAKYALEMNQGWFAKHRIKAGVKITGLPKP